MEFSTSPDTWKQSLIIPIQKVKNPVTYKDLRHISILPTISKSLDKIVVKQLKDYLLQNNILPPTQSGFRTLHF